MITRDEYAILVKKLESVGYEKIYTALTDTPEHSGSLWKHKVSGKEFFWNYRYSKKDIEKLIEKEEE